MRRVAVAALSALLLGGLPAAALTPSAESPPGSPGSGSGAFTTAQATATAPETHSVTLITGDRVAVRGSGDARAFTPIAAPRPDGRTVTFHSVRQGDAHYVFPSDIAPLVGDALDLALFDVAGLVEAGYDDATLAAAGRSSLPVIVQSTPSRARSAGAADWADLGLSRERTLQSIGAVAGTVDVATGDGDRPAKAWGLLRAVGAGFAADGARAKTRSGVTKVWLDGRVEALDADSTPQVGAPEAWADGYTGEGVTIAVVDTGVDTTHPDLDENVVAERDFTGGDNPSDGFGHGTHVASIAAGTGDADPDMIGVAPGADIINAKVLDDQGFGEWSWIIDGMEWAAGEGAQVLNLSLGEPGSFTDGTDPASQAVNALTEQYGVLVVAAAGNDGPRAGTVSPPAVADSALAVAAVDDDDAQADFSSAGPRAGDGALKPEIAGPGVDIVAARAAGTEMGEPVGDSYVTASGTSMAAPHVAGAAAVLLSADPDLTWQQIRSTLMASAQPGGNSVWQEGSGRVWIPGAIEQQVTASPASVSLGGFEFPQDDLEPVTKTLTYTSTADTDETLDLTVDITSDGEPAAGAVTLSADSVTVPAGGSATVDVTAHPADHGVGDFGGVITATGAGGTVRTAVGFVNQPELFDLTISATDLDGSPAEEDDFFVVQGIDDPDYFTFAEFGEDGTSTSRVPAGRYTVSGFTSVSDEAFGLLSTTSAAFPLVDVTEDTALTVDGEAAQPVTIDTPRETGVGTTSVDLIFETDEMGMFNGFFGDLGDLYALPVPEPADGHFQQTWTSLLDEKTLDVRADDLGLDLDLVLLALTEPVTGTSEVPLVDAGLGGDFSGAEGSWAFVDHAGPDTLQGVADAAAAAGVEALLVAGSETGNVLDWVESAQLPVFGVPSAQAESLRTALAAGPVTLSVAGKAAPSYSYALAFGRDGSVPDEPISYVADRSTTGSVRVSVTAPAPGASPYVGGSVSMWGIGVGMFSRAPAPHTRTVFVSADEDVTYAPAASVTEEDPFDGMFEGPGRSLAPGEKTSDRLLAPVFHGGISGGAALRAGDAMEVYLSAYVDDAGHSIWGLPGEDAQTRLRLWSGKELVADSDGSTYVSAEGLPAERTPYRLRLDTAFSGDWWSTSTDVTTDWRFRSAATDSGDEFASIPLLQVDYGVPAALDGTVPRTARLTLSADHQPGTEGGDVTGMRLWASSDDGKSWREVAVRRGKGDTFRAVVRAARGAEFVSLKAQAVADDGGRVTETVVRAYRVE
ncbi:S8 family serine peptidase [Promicromonospora iranensis]|uniref:S8 family serine peptidase n=1 Tax=Promicromonospora iranensis TaxID=1105144 RepID=UPI0023A980F4|nr:S8 family serine peptidase [Promicromonospora iranensis]